MPLYDPISFEYILFEEKKMWEKIYYFVYFTQMASHSSTLPKKKEEEKYTIIPEWLSHCDCEKK